MRDLCLIAVPSLLVACASSTISAGASPEIKWTATIAVVALTLAALDSVLHLLIVLFPKITIFRTMDARVLQLEQIVEQLGGTEAAKSIAARISALEKAHVASEVAKTEPPDAKK